MRQNRGWTLLTLALLNIFTLAAGLTARDVVASRPPDPTLYPVVHAEDPAAAELSQDAPVNAERLAERLDDRIQEARAGDGLSAYVVDATTGDRIYAHREDHGAVPASTTKIATAVAALHTVGPEHRITTRVVRGESPGEIVLVGGGDPTLTEDIHSDAYPRVATLRALAGATAESLLAAGVEEVELRYDDSLYPGPALGPEWKPGYVNGGSVAPVHALMLDGGRKHKDEQYSARVDDPSEVAAEAFARRLTEMGVDVRGAPAAARARADAEQLAQVESAPVSSLVETMMTQSENNIAEALARQVALARDEEPSFTGAAQAVTSVMGELDVSNVHIADGSGLSVANEITAQALVDLLTVAAAPERPRLRYALTGLPVANFTGTLEHRYSSASQAARGAGLVRGKTGTLQGVRTLAGLAYDVDGRLLVFAFMANGSAAGESALDGLAATLVECEC